jgi:thiopeptide-type bacteriocin biosynthesis protein
MSKRTAPSEAARPRPPRASAAPLFEPLDFVLCRAPLLPIEAYLALGDSSSDDASTLLPQDPRVRRALAVASPQLLTSLTRAAAGDGDEPDLRVKLTRYLIRMSTRPTPFGLFAGVALARWGDKTDLALDSAAPRTRTRPDMTWLYSLVMAAEARPEVRQHLRLVANPTAFSHDGRIYLSERASAAGAGGAADISVRATKAVRLALAAARRPVPYADLAALVLEQTPGATPEKVATLLSELWQQTILLTDLRPPVTCASPARHVAQRLLAVPPARQTAAQIEAVLGATQAWDSAPGEDGEATFREMVGRAKAVSVAAGDAPFQVDCALSMDGERLARAVGAEAAAAAELLLRLTPLPHGVPYLDVYRSAFLDRYGSDREVPLLKLLDPQCGLGPPNPYGGASAIPPQRAARRSETLLHLAHDALRGHHRVIELDAETLDRLQTWSPDPVAAPRSLDLCIAVAARSAAAIDAGEFELVIGPNLGAMSAGRTLGRFGDLLGTDSRQALEQAARAEEALDPGRIWAELVYLPSQLHAANVVIRPAVRPYEIAAAVTPGVPDERVIPLDELTVGVRGGRFYLRWQRHDAEVVACSGHMLNSFRAPALCRFLFELGRDGLPQLSTFDWGPAFGFPFLPRVRVGRIVLSLAQWRLDATARERAFGKAEPAAFGAALARWRDTAQVPRYVYLSAGDNRLLLDLDDPTQAEQLRGEVRRAAEGSAVLLQEVYPDLDQAWLRGPGGRYASEFVVSLVRRAMRPQPAVKSKAAPPAEVPAAAPRASASVEAMPAESRLRPPGCEWLYVKLYGPPTFQDDLVAYHMRTLAADLLASGAAQEWFFLRYADPQPHLRLRFRGDPLQLTGHVMPIVCDWASGLMAQGLCRQFCFDTYDRELERYGGQSASEVAETIFHADSRLIADVLHLTQEGRLRLDRTILAVLGIDTLLAGLGLDPGQRLRWCRSVVTWRDEVGPEYRWRKNILRAFLGLPHYVDAQLGGSALVESLARRGAALAAAAEQLARLAERGELNQQPTALYGSYIHMHCNRLTGADPSLERRTLGLLLRTREGLDRAPVVARFPIDDD